MEDCESDLVSVVSMRRTVLVQERKELEEKLAALSGRLDRVKREIEHVEGILQLHEASAPEGSPSPLESHLSLVVGTTKKGQASADDVVEMLETEERAMHYREIESELRARGFTTAGGKDPANTMLARYFNDSRLERVGRGTYRTTSDQARTVPQEEAN